MKRLLIGLAVVVALASACGQSSQPPKQAHAKPSATPTVLVPTRLQIPRIGVDAPVEQVGVDNTNNMETPRLLSEVAWYKGGTPSDPPGIVPGQPGDAVIAGHKDSVRGEHGIFWSLTDVQVGDEFTVIVQSGARLRFKVTDTKSVGATSNTKDLGLFATSGAPRLTLITCTGQTNAQRTAYLDRLIVNASYEGQG